ncbi:inosine/xanthosine triphosphatase [Vitiosangium sp. GDMCC 1.1324]|uniref:inosine/xanthosine triphosphatase n=1 Tax=Vitiosangium sp. (strain GDMCC 1.1324) TaxID=2138576 RepID=UPI000D33D23A|nr:inosine/xanthosine triphosphatase [Vitiosangium sp. GDMCC 1.1324]PTL80390.1 inosine/xanthosine triphosphatase [Vitiosangium sp. GDMCC 1.1324]
MSIIIAVGSTNPAKTSAVKAICERAFPGCTVIPIDVPSGVREQPIGPGETSTGARNRARAALGAVPGAQMGVGLEGGVDPDGSLINGVAVVEVGGRENLTWGVRFPLPPAVVARVLNGEELGPVMDQVSGRTESKKHLGAVGILSNGLFTRAEMWQGPMACALMPFLHPELYPAPAPSASGS